MKFDKNSVADFKQSLSELKNEAPAEKTQNLSNKDIVNELAPEIKSLQDDGYTTEQIFGVLVGKGLTCSLASFESYVRNALSAKKKKARKRPTRKTEESKTDQQQTAPESKKEPSANSESIAKEKAEQTEQAKPEVPVADSEKNPTSTNFVIADQDDL